MSMLDFGDIEVQSPAPNSSNTAWDEFFVYYTVFLCSSLSEKLSFQKDHKQLQTTSPKIIQNGGKTTAHSANPALFALSPLLHGRVVVIVTIPTANATVVKFLSG